MIIAHDLGTTADKASLHTDDGTLVTSATAAYPTQYLPGGAVEQNPHDWWDAVVRSSRELLERTGTSAGDISAISVSGHMMGGVFLDGDLEPVRAAMIWADTRSGAETDRLIARVGQDAGYRITGHPLNPTYTLPKVMWVQEREPDAWGRVRHIAFAKDYVNARLTGRLVTDASDASGASAYDQSARDWSQELLDAAGVQKALFPEIAASTQILGGLLPEPAALLGLRPGIPVVVGGGDGPMAALGAGIVAPEDGAYVSLGTSSWISFAADAPLHDPHRRTMSFNHVVPGRFVPTATMQTGAGALDWIAGVLEPGGGSDRFARLVGEAENIDASGEGLYFLPHLLGERSPHWNATVRASFVGLSRAHERAHMTRAVLEGVAFNLGTCLRAFRQSGARIDRVDAVGGGAKSDTWLQILADVWGVPVRRRTIVDEANSLGAAVLGAIGIGAVASADAARALSEVTAVFEPDAARAAAYASGQARFEDAYQRLEGWYDGGGSA
ncbi:xylulokinase [Microbacterium sp. zg.B48]|uniref:xylulokinase n=1 Tax=Microbacterium sp. zg.B48 TaxID=2969408 RepID=UPI00214AB960|nr:xylulokinase [Microbacterium sp. zg.B48]MCR2762821.1 xylulokinase [Microbacterium sp. zg.B48]